MSVLKSIIDKLTSINFWTIIASLIAIATAGVAIYQHKSVKVEPRLLSIPLDDEEKVLFVLFNYDQANSDSVFFELPINFYNPSNKAVELEYTLHSVGKTYFTVPNSVDPNNPNKGTITILREEAASANIQFKASRKEIAEKGRIEKDLYFMWSYENMSDRNRIWFQYVVLPYNDSAANYVIQEDWIIELVDDGTKSGHFSLLKATKNKK